MMDRRRTGLIAMALVGLVGLLALGTPVVAQTPPADLHLYGGSGGGPVIIPRGSYPLSTHLVRLIMAPGAFFTTPPGAVFTAQVLAGAVVWPSFPATMATPPGLPPVADHVPPGSSFGADRPLPFENPGPTPAVVVVWLTGTGADTPLRAAGVRVTELGGGPLTSLPALPAWVGLRHALLQSGRAGLDLDTGRDGVALVVAEYGPTALIVEGGETTLRHRTASGVLGPAQPVARSPGLGPQLTLTLRPGDAALIQRGGVTAPGGARR